MPNNHFLPCTYLRGFCNEEGKLVVRDALTSEILEIEEPEKIGYESAPAEPEIETLRSDLEQFWGGFRTDSLRNLHTAPYKSRKLRVALFIAQSMLLSKFGRQIVRDLPSDRPEALRIAETAQTMQRRFVQMKWLTADTPPGLFCGEAPFAIDSPGEFPLDDLANWKRIWFPITKSRLLCLNETNSGHVSAGRVAYAFGDSEAVGTISEEDQMFALRLYTQAKQQLLNVAKAGKFQIYSPYWD